MLIAKNRNNTAKYFTHNSISVGVVSFNKMRQLNVKYKLWFHHFMANRWGNMETVTDFIFLGSKITVAMKLKDTCSFEEKL